MRSSSRKRSCFDKKRNTSHGKSFMEEEKTNVEEIKDDDEKER